MNRPPDGEYLNVLKLASPGRSDWPILARYGGFFGTMYRKCLRYIDKLPLNEPKVSGFQTCFRLA
jgi:hypothetical protein